MQFYYLTNFPKGDKIGGPRASASLTPRPEIQLYHRKQLLSIGKIDKNNNRKIPEIVQCDEKYFCAGLPKKWQTAPQSLYAFSIGHFIQKLTVYFVQFF